MFIVFPSDEGLAVISPNPEWDLREVALKDVPAGVPFRYLEAFPDEGAVLDFSAPDGYGMGASAWFALRAAQ